MDHRGRVGLVARSGSPRARGDGTLAVIERTPAERETVAWRKSLKENGL